MNAQMVLERQSHLIVALSKKEVLAAAGNERLIMLTIAVVAHRAPGLFIIPVGVVHEL